MTTAIRGSRRFPNRSAACRSAVLTAITLALASGSDRVDAQSNWPTRPLRMIVPAAPGGGADTIARFVAQRIGDQLGQTVIIDNRSGAAGTIAADLTAKSAPDGHTVLMAQSTSVAIAPALYKNLPYDTLRDLAPVSLVAEVPNVLVVNAKSAPTSVKELIALARAKPDQITYPSAGAGAPSHLAGEMFARMAGVQMLHVPYKGAGPALAALIGGEVQSMFAPLVAVLPHLKAGRLRALAVTTAKRAPALPDLPTIAESGLPKYAIGSWFGLLMSAKTPRDTVNRMHAETIKALKHPETRDRLQAEGAEIIGNTPDQFRTYIKEEMVRYAVLIKEAGIRID
ncbi:MAG: tripartite tricarboxylate transporter substrate binding protein [Proteobacteria bacterium]|nr:tripartite tricarboxylate transporter substrate binding protein [Burkholderiales bacterium]